jgi:uncharacterized membrane protein
MVMERLLKNLMTGRWHLRRLLSPVDAATITEAVSAAERTTSAQIKVVIEASLDLSPLLRGQTARERALEVFGVERVWDTAANNGILLYILVSERDAEIVVDRGFNGAVAPDEWLELCSGLTSEIKTQGFVSAVLHGIERISAMATRVFPSTDHVNELSDDVRIRT